MDALNDQLIDNKGFLSPEFTRQLSQYFDAVGVVELEKTLRLEITDYLNSEVEIEGRMRKGSYRLLAEATGISRTYINDFHAKERAICITNMNLLARYFSVKYIVSNF